jgi:hypothetical protein
LELRRFSNWRYFRKDSIMLAQPTDLLLAM